jgi:hypothetical protein
MVDLQEAANLAIVIGLAVSVFFNALQYFYGPWAKRREFVRETIAKVVNEIRGAKAAASKPTMNVIIGRFETWAKDGRRLPRRIRWEVEQFVQICESYRDTYLLAEKLVKLLLYEAVLNRPTLPRAPKIPPKGYGDPMWLARGTGGPIPAWSLHEALATALVEPLLQGQSVRWSWVADHQPEFAGQLAENVGDSIANSMLEDLENKLAFDPNQIIRPREIRATILNYHFKSPGLRNE